MLENPFLRPAIPEVHGHRGCRGLRPENTIAGFLHALALGVDVLELDVVISADHEIVVSHEPWLNPLFCSGPAGESLSPVSSGATHNLYHMRYSLIQKCACGLPYPDFPEQVSLPAFKPLLRDVLLACETYAAQQTARRSVAYSIEIKSLPEWDGLYHPAPATFLDLVLEQIDQCSVADRTTLLSFDPRILRHAHLVRPHLPTCLLLEAEQDWFASLRELDFVPHTLGPNHHTVTPTVVAQLRTQYPRLRLVPWTVNEKKEFIRLMTLGVDGITTDYPNRLIDLLLGLKSEYRPL